MHLMVCVALTNSDAAVLCFIMLISYRGVQLSHVAYCVLFFFALSTGAIYCNVLAGFLFLHPAGILYACVCI